MTPEERAQAIVSRFWPAEPKGEAGDLKQMIVDAIQAALDEDRAAWYPAQRAVMAEFAPGPPQFFMSTFDGRTILLAQWYAEQHGPKPWPKTVEIGAATYLVCPRCGSANIGNLCSICRDYFPWPTTEDPTNAPTRP